MASQTVFEEITGVLEMPAFKGGDTQPYLTKLTGKLNTLTDEQWEDLDEDTQHWCNAATKAADSDKPIPVPAGMEDDDDDEEEEAKPTKRVKAKAKANGASKPAAKPAKGKAKAKVAEEEDDEEEDEAPKKPAKVKAKGKPAKAAKAEKPAKKKGKGKGGLTGKRARLYTDDQRIVVIVKGNPKREGTNAYDRFALYEKGKKGMTVKAALAAGVNSGDLKYDVDHEFITIT